MHRYLVVPRALSERVFVVPRLRDRYVTRLLDEPAKLLHGYGILGNLERLYLCITAVLELNELAWHRDECGVIAVRRFKVVADFEKAERWQRRR